MRNVIGLDIGIKSIKLANLALRGKSVELLKLEIIDAPKISNQNETIDLLKSMFKKNKLKLNTPVCLSISAEESFFKVISVKSKGSRRLKEAIRDELKSNVVFSLEDCIWDYSLLKYQPKQTLNEVLLVAAKRDAVFEKMQLIKNFNNSARLINLDILASYNCLRFNTELLSGKLYALVNISSTKTQVLIFDDGENFWMRTLPFGGDKFTDCIAQQLKLSQSEAEEYKKNMLLQEDMPLQLKEPSALAMNEMSAELDKTFNYYYFQTSDPSAKVSGHKIDEIFLSGGGSLFLNLDKSLSSALNIPVRHVYPLSKVEIKDQKLLSRKKTLHVESAQFVTAVGLGLQGLNSGEIKVNLIKEARDSLILNEKMAALYNIFVVVSVAIIVFLSTQIFSLNRSIKKMLPRSKELNTISGEYMPKLVELKAANDQTSAQIHIFNTTVTNRDMISRILKKISEMISKEAWVTNFVFKINYENRSGELTLGGKAASYPEINELISGFKDTGYFENIKPVSSKVMIDQETKEEVVNFLIKMEFKEL